MDAEIRELLERAEEELHHFEWKTTESFSGGRYFACCGNPEFWDGKPAPHGPENCAIMKLLYDIRKHVDTPE